MAAFIPLAIMAAGAGARAIGNRRDANKQRKQVQLANKQPQQSGRSSARSALVRGILDANGFGGMLSDKQIEMMMQPTPAIAPGVPSMLGPIGGGLSSVGQAMLMAQQGGEEQEQGNDDWWEDFYRQLGQNQSAYGGAPRSGGGGPFSYGGENAP